MTLTSRLVAGLDDAGRGSILGPLVIAGVVVREDRLQELKALGVRDSKLMSPFGRARVYPEILKVSQRYHVWKLFPEEIDKFVKERKKYRKLNYLEAVTMSRIINMLKPDIAYVDASDTEPERFKTNILENLMVKAEIVSLHRADVLIPVVSAASVIAKVERDREIERLKASYGDFGSGYPSDPRTRSFLRNWLKDHETLPTFSRKSWKTWKKLGQRELTS